jgi:KDO2-lipid IV(A) lauroyltransferase
VQRAQVVALRATVRLLRLLPWQAAAALGGWIGRVGYAPLGIRRRVVERQVAAAFPALDAKGVARIARRAYDSLGRTSIETAMLSSLEGRGILELFAEVDGWEHLEAAMAGGRGVVIVTGHVGNWELGGAYVAARGVPLDAIYFPAANPAFNAYLAAARARIGMRVITVSDAPRAVPRALRDGRAVAFLTDQALLNLSASATTFFGRPTWTPRGAAVFAIRAGAPVIYAEPTRRPDGRYRFVFEPVPYTVTGDKDADVDALAQAYTTRLEQTVRAVPEQYFWHHRRWKRQPDGTPPELGDPSA